MGSENPSAEAGRPRHRLLASIISILTLLALGFAGFTGPWSGAGTQALAAVGGALHNGDLIQVRGMIDHLPSDGLRGMWQVSGLAVQVSSDTRLDQGVCPAAAGADVEVHGWLQADGSLQADWIRVLAAPRAPTDAGIPAGVASVEAGIAPSLELQRSTFARLAALFRQAGETHVESGGNDGTAITATAVIPQTLVLSNRTRVTPEPPTASASGEEGTSQAAATVGQPEQEDQPAEQPKPAPAIEAPLPGAPPPAVPTVVAPPPVSAPPAPMAPVQPGKEENKDTKEQQADKGAQDQKANKGGENQKADKPKDAPAPGHDAGSMGSQLQNKDAKPKK